MLDYRIKTFLALCRLKNYTKTAEELFITQPAVSQHIKYLEELYGVSLFTYKGKTLTLTKQGEALRRFALSVQNDIHKLSNDFKNTLAQRQFKFGATLTIGEYTMPPIIKKLLSETSNITVTMLVDNTEILLDFLQKGVIDFAFIEGSFNKAEYGYKLFSKEKFIGIGSPKLYKNDEILTLEDLYSHRLILREQGSGTRTIFESILAEHSISLESFSSVCEFGSLNVIKDFVSDGYGISFMYEQAAKKDLAEGKLCILPIKEFEITREFNFVYLKNSQFEEIYVDFLSFCLKTKNCNFITEYKEENCYTSSCVQPN